MKKGIENEKKWKQNWPTRGPFLEGPENLLGPKSVFGD